MSAVDNLDAEEDSEIGWIEITTTPFVNPGRSEASSSWRVKRFEEYSNPLLSCHPYRTMALCTWKWWVQVRKLCCFTERV